MLALVSNFLIGRKQRVVLNGTTSEWQNVVAGVPQGSVLGLLFFLVYINDLCDNLSCDVKLFADDTSLFSVVENKDVSARKLNRDLERIRLWAWQWKKGFNVEETEEVIFSSTRVKPLHPPLSMANTDISRVY